MRLLRHIRKLVAYKKRRSPKWRHIRRLHLEKEGWCRVCGGTQNLEVHHIKPFHLYPELELVDSNLITLCEAKGRECHLHWGHFDNWRDINPDIRSEATSTEVKCPSVYWNKYGENPPSSLRKC